MIESSISAEKKFELSRTETYITKHYVFHYQPGTLAEKEIKEIAQIQERAFSRICGVLGVCYPERINYYFTDSPVEIGSIFWDQGTSCNGCAVCGDNKVYAVYNEDVKCIGEHEDTHLIAHLIGEPASSFLSEGLAMYFHANWWGVPNEDWAAYYKEQYPRISVEAMLDNDQFSEHGEEITYPVAGAFTRFLIDTYGMNPYKELYKYGGMEYSERIKSIYHVSLQEIEQTFWNAMAQCVFDSDKLAAMSQR